MLIVQCCRQDRHTRGQLGELKAALETDVQHTVRRDVQLPCHDLVAFIPPQAEERVLQAAKSCQVRQYMARCLACRTWHAPPQRAARAPTPATARSHPLCFQVPGDGSDLPATGRRSRAPEPTGARVIDHADHTVRSRLRGSLHRDHRVTGIRGENNDLSSTAAASRLLLPSIARI